MIQYTIIEYLRITQNLDLNKLHDVSEEYHVSKNNKINIQNSKFQNLSHHHKHDKIFRLLLNNKHEATYLINKFLNPVEKLTEDEIEKYDTRYITSKFDDKETDIVYKLKNKEVFFLIEHQTKIDNQMAYRMLEYSLEVIRSRLQNVNTLKSRNNKNKMDKVKVPRVIPIVLYTGEKSWTPKKTVQEIQVDFKLLSGVDSLIGYNLIDIRNKEEALTDTSLISKMSVLERMEDTEEIVSMIQQMEKIVTEQDKRKLLSFLLRYLLDSCLDRQMLSVIKKLEMKGGVENMHVVEVLKKDKEKARREARKEGIFEGMMNVAKNMLNEGVDIDFISRMTGIDKSKLVK